MASSFNRVKVGIATLGQGTITFGARAGTTFYTPSEAGALDGDDPFYVLTEGGDEEHGRGVIGGSVTTMTRTVIKSIIGGVVGTTKLTLAGGATLAFVETKELFEKLVRVDAAQSFSASERAQGLKNLAQASLAKSADYTVVEADRGTYISLTGTHTLSFTAAATLGDDWSCMAGNDGSGTWTLDPNSSEQIDGAATLSLRPGERCRVLCNGTAFRTINGRSEFASGTAMLFQQTSAPTGWTKQTTHNDKALRVVSGTAGSGGSSAFSTVFGKTATDAFTLTTTEMPSHGHPGTYYAANGGGSQSLVYGDTGAITFAVPAQGGGGSHAHGMDIRVQYVDVIIATKD